MTSVELHAHATNTCACDILVIVFILMRIRPSTQIRSRYECVFVLIHFQERFQIDAFTTKTLIVLVWTEGLNASKCMRFQTHERQMKRGVRVKWRDSPFLPSSRVCRVIAHSRTIVLLAARNGELARWLAFTPATFLEPLTNHNITDHISQLLCGLGEKGLTLRKRAGRDVKNKIYFCFTWLCLQ